MRYATEVRKYLDRERMVLEALDEYEISHVMELLEKARLSRKRIFVCGNGGSAATASHFVCDFNKGISMTQKEKYDFVCLNDNVPWLMAIANDTSYDEVFVQQLQSRISEDDVLIAISGSGNSKNVVEAVEYANTVGAITIGLVGYNGGKIKEIAQSCIHVKIDNMQIVEDIHMAIDHVMMFVLSGKVIDN